MAISSLLAVNSQSYPTPGAAAPEALTNDLLVRSPTLYPLRHELIVLPVSVGNINNGSWALNDQLQDSLVPLCLGAYSTAPPGAAERLVI